MIYPTINEYISALEESQDNFDKLSSLRLCTDGGGHPIMSSGNFAVVFKMQDAVTQKYKAVKCFTREQVGREESYAKIAAELKYEYSDYIVEFEYFDKELYVYSESCTEEFFPVVVMDWVNGIPLDSYIRLHATNKYALELLTYQFCLLASWLLSQPFAHGDLKPDNILVKPNGAIVLVDYDGMYVPSMKGEKGRESGTPGYVHPLHTTDDFNEHIDDFALAVISLSLKAYALDNKIFRPSETLLFRANDYDCISRTIKDKRLNRFLGDTDYSSLYGLFLYVLNNQHIDSSLYSLFRITKPEKKESTLNFIDTETYEYEFVDLGLSVLWSRLNLGALKEIECGDYFSWNDIQDNENFAVRNKDVCEINIVEYYHNQNNNINIDHIVGNETRLPTIAEFNELINKCKWEQTCIQGVNGYDVIGPNGNKIFLPISGDRQGETIESVNEYGQYLSGTYHNDKIDHYLLLRYYENEYTKYEYNNGLTTGRTIRPVLQLSKNVSGHSISSSNFIEPDFVDLGLSVLWSKVNLGAAIETENGNYFNWNDIKRFEYFKIISNEKCEIDITKYNKELGLSSTIKDTPIMYMPTRDNFQELINKCTWEKKSIHGINGYKVIGPNGNYIFLPISGKLQKGKFESVNMYAQYLTAFYNNDRKGHYLLIRYDDNIYKLYSYDDGLETGRSIRPVIGRHNQILGNQQISVKSNVLFVDLGLSVKWATCNLGATRPEEYGDYVAWGNDSIKTSFYDSDCSTHDISNSELLKNGIVNIDGCLTPQNDIATITLGKGWRIPTVDEFNELIKKCKWTLISNSIYKVEGPNGNHILLPLNDYIKGREHSGDTGYYWTSSIGEKEKEAFGFYMYEEPHCSSGTDRSDGQAIRPVRD